MKCPIPITWVAYVSSLSRYFNILYLARRAARKTTDKNWREGGRERGKVAGVVQTVGGVTGRAVPGRAGS